MFQSPESFLRAEAAGFTWERRAPRPEDDRLSAHTQNWLSALPKGVRPVHLPAEFPRITNELSRLWLQTAALDTYFEDLEFNPRPDRMGFPAVVKEELLCMHVYSLRNRSKPSEERLPQQASFVG